MQLQKILERLRDNVQERIETDKRICSETPEADIDDILDVECLDCGKRYYSDYLMSNLVKDESAGEICIDCYLSE